MLTDVFCSLNLDAIILSDSNNIRYCSGFTGEGYILLTHSSKYVITDSRYLFLAQNELTGYEIKLIDDSTLFSILNGIIKGSRLVRVGFENLSCKYSFVYMLSKIKDINLIKLGSLVDDLREIKSEDEINQIRKAISIGDIVYKSVLKKIKRGMTEREIAALIDYLLRKNGADGNSFDTIVASGINTTMPHAVPSDKKLSDGEFVIMDFGCKFNGYCSDMTRTVFLGEPNKEQVMIYNIVKKAKDKAESEAFFGMSGKQIDEIARNVIDENGFSKEFMHGTGHGVGLFIHEKPSINKRYESTVPVNSVFSIEPGIYIKDKFGVRLEDLCVMTNDGIKILTGSSDELLCL